MVTDGWRYLVVVDLALLLDAPLESLDLLVDLPVVRVAVHRRLEQLQCAVVFTSQSPVVHELVWQVLAVRNAGE